jgi:hypothetical protein
MGTSSVSLFDCRRFPHLRHLFESIGVGFAQHQQRFFRADLHPDFSNRAPDLFRESRGRFGLDLGPSALCNVLVHALGLGNKFFSTAIGRYFLARADHGRTRRLKALDRVWPALGNCRAEQHHRAKRRKPSLGGIVLASLIFIACITPWTVRNYRTFGKFIFIRDNIGAELRLGNGPGADGTWMQYLHPTQDTYAMRQYTSMGELAYIDRRQRQALDYIKADYGRFALLCLKRFIYFWAGPPRLAQIWWLAPAKNSLFLASSVLMFWGLGRALRQRKPGVWLLFWLIVLYPFIYYVVYPGQRYRHPIEPEMTILGVFLLTETGKKGPIVARR